MEADAELPASANKKRRRQKHKSKVLKQETAKLHTEESKHEAPENKTAPAQPHTNTHVIVAADDEKTIAGGASTEVYEKNEEERELEEELQNEIKKEEGEHEEIKFDPECTVFVGRMSKKVKEQEITNFFSENVGTIR